MLRKKSKSVNYINKKSYICNIINKPKKTNQKKTEKMKKSILKFSLITSLMLFLTSCAFAQFVPSAVNAAYPTTRATPRASNIVMGYANGGNLTALNAIGVFDGAYSLGTTNTSDTLSGVRVFGNLNALGGMAFQVAVDSAALYKVQVYAQTIIAKHNGTDSIYLPSTASLKSLYGNVYNPTGAGAIITVINTGTVGIFVRGNLRGEYVDTATTYGIPQRSAKSFIFTGLSVPTSTVVSANKLNATWQIR